MGADQEAFEEAFAEAAKVQLHPAAEEDFKETSVEQAVNDKIQADDVQEQQKQSAVRRSGRVIRPPKTFHEEFLEDIKNEASGVTQVHVDDNLEALLLTAAGISNDSNAVLPEAHDEALGDAEAVIKSLEK